VLSNGRSDYVRRVLPNVRDRQLKLLTTEKPEWRDEEQLSRKRLRHELTLPLSVPILKRVRLYGLLIRRVPRMIWRGCKGVPPDGYARSGTK